MLQVTYAVLVIFYAINQSLTVNKSVDNYEKLYHRHEKSALCEDVASGTYISHPYDCTKFIECLDEEEEVLSCEYGYSWNENMKICDTNTETNCKDSSVTPAPITTPPSTTTTTEGTTTANPLCEGHLSGSYIQHPTDCTKFIECVNGQAEELQCDYGMSWNEDKKICDDNTEENCKDSSVTPGPITTPEPTTTTTLGTTTPDPLCEGQLSGSYVKYPWDCTKFIECVGGQAEVLQCEYGASWNDDKKICDDNTDENCKDSSVTPGPITTPEPTTTTTLGTTTPDPLCEGQLSGSYVKYPWDCTKFIECVGGQAEVLQCEYGASWNDDKKICDDNTDENCKDSSVTPGPITTPEPTTTTTLGTTTPDPLCEGQLSGSYVKYPWDCTKFIECVGGQAEVLHCEYGASWNDDKKICDDNTDENCKDSSVTPGPITTPEPTTTTTLGTTTPDPLCEGQLSGSYVKYPWDCTKFIECVGGQAEVLQCEYGASWNDDKKICDDNTDENCKDSSVTPGPITTPEPTTTTTLGTTTADPLCEGQLSGSYVKYPWDCTKFIECVGGQAEVLQCEYGASWNDDKKICDDNTDENCKDSSVTPGPITTPEPTTTTTLGTTTADPLCEGVASGSYIKHPTDCTKFIECVNGQADVLQCDDGQSWNEDKKICDDNDANCNGASTTSIGTTISGDCPSTGLYYYPDYENCTQFYECDDGVKSLMYCPAGYAWDLYKSECLLADTVDCSYITIAPETISSWEQTCPSSGLSYLPHYSNCAKYYECNDGAKTVKECNEGFLWNIIINTCDAAESVDCSYNCPDTGIDYLPNYGNCSKFFKCDEGNRIPMQCPEGFAWSATDTACELEENVDCSYLTTPSPITTTPANECPETGTSYLPNYYDCTKFFKCEEGEKIDMECPEGFAWDDERKSCDLLENVDCKYVTITTKNPDNDCPSSGVTYLPDYYNCSRFYECNQGDKISMPCPDGYAWDINNGACKLAENVDCSYVTVSPTENPTITTNGYTSDPSCSSGISFIPHPYDCSLYYECINGRKVLMPCAEGYLFSIETNTCELTNTVDCSYTSPGGPTDATTKPFTGTTETSPTSAPAPIDDLCKDQSDGTFVAYPSDCTMFVQCRSNEGILYQCQSGSSWNQNQQVCDTNNVENCSGRTSATRTSSGTTPSNKPTRPSDVTTGSTTRGYTADPSCPEDGTAYLPHPTNCSLYYECINGRKVLMPCADGYLFNTEINGCDIAANVDCNHLDVYPMRTTSYPNIRIESPLTTRTHISSSIDVLCVGQADETFLIHPTDCAKFIQCKSEEAILHQCATGSGWNESSKKCDSNITC